MKLRRNEKGYTLVEALVTIAILAVAGGIVFGFVLTATRFFSDTRNETNVQTEAQTALNWLSDALEETAYGVVYRTVGGTEEDPASGDHVLEIYNQENVYTITWDPGAQVLYCKESQWTVDPEDGVEKLIPLSADAEDNILAEYVTDFTVVLPDEEDASAKPVVYLTLSMDRNGRAISMNRSVTLRNDVAINQEAETVYKSARPVVSSVSAVEVIPKESYCTPGNTVSFSARVTGVGFPSQSVVWSIVGLAEGSSTTIDASTGLLEIAENETADSFIVQATSVDTDTDGNYVQSPLTMGLVKMMKIDSVEITDKPTEKLLVGEAVTLHAAVHGNNMDAANSGVVWSIPEDKNGGPVKGATVNSSGVVMLGMELYNTFAEQREDATIWVRAASAAQPEIYDDCLISLHFDNVDLNFENVNYIASRNGYLDLNEKLQKQGTVTDDMRLVWSITDDEGLGSKVTLDKSLGMLSVSKNIDYDKEYTLQIEAQMTRSGSSQTVDTAHVTVVIPKVELSIGEEAKAVNKGTSARLPYTIKGLIASDEDMVIRSTPAVRNTLLYVQGGELVVSLGTDISKASFQATLSLQGYPTINDQTTIRVAENDLSASKNVEDLFLYVPVPGSTKEMDQKAPTIAQLKQGDVSLQVGDLTVKYSYNTARQRSQITIGSAQYFYRYVAGTEICWYLPNCDGTDGAMFYAPAPGNSAFPTSELSDNSNVEIPYRGEQLKYRRFEVNKYLGKSEKYFIYQVYDNDTKQWFQYSEAQKLWVNTKKENKALKGTAVASSQNSNTTGAGNAIDGSTSTSWRSLSGSNNKTQYIIVDLGSVYNLSSVKVSWSNSAYASTYEIYVTNDRENYQDKVNWTRIGQYSNNRSSSSTLNCQSGTNARYVIIYATQFRTGYSYYSISELEIQGQGLN